MTGCEPTDVPANIDEAMLIGVWHASDNKDEYWRFDNTHHGETWDLSEDVQEGEGTRFGWSAVEDVLRIDLHGEMGQHVYYDYTVTDQKRDSFTWKDHYGRSREFHRKKI